MRPASDKTPMVSMPLSKILVSDGYRSGQQALVCPMCPPGSDLRDMVHVANVGVTHDGNESRALISMYCENGNHLFFVELETTHGRTYVHAGGDPTVAYQDFEDAEDAATCISLDPSLFDDEGLDHELEAGQAFNAMRDEASSLAAKLVTLRKHSEAVAQAQHALLADIARVDREMAELVDRWWPT